MTIIRVTKKLLKFLNTHQRFRIFELGILMIIGAGLETMTVMLFGIFANCLMDTEVTSSNRLLALFSKITGIYEPERIIMFFAIGLAILYIVKNMYTIWEYSVQVGFTSANNTIMQNKILKNVMARPYEYYLYADSGEMIRFATQDVLSVFSMLSELLNFYTEFIVTLVLIIVALVQTPVMSIGIASILFVSLMLVMKKIKPSLSRIGREYRKLRAKTNKSFLEMIEGIKEVKVLQKEDYFRNNYYNAAISLVKLDKRLTILRLLPKNIIESTCMAGVFIVTALLIRGGNDLDEILSSIAMTAMIAVRLLPSVNRISGVLTQISLNEEVIDNVAKTYNESNDNAQEKTDEKSDQVNTSCISFNEKVEIKNLKYSYPNSNKNVIDDCTLSISKGESIGVIGPSGGGKTTLLNLLLALLRPTCGDVLSDGVSIYKDRRAWLSHIGFIPQSIFIIDENIRENIAFGVNPKDIDDEKIRKVIKAAALDDFVDSLPDGIYSSVGERGIRISGGQRQRIGIARALYFDPDILFFDEATSALDVNTESEIMQSIDALRGKITMVIVAHRHSTVMGCDRIWKVQNGAVREVGKEELSLS